MKKVKLTALVIAMALFCSFALTACVGGNKYIGCYATSTIYNSSKFGVIFFPAEMYTVLCRKFAVDIARVDVVLVVFGFSSDEWFL